MPLEPRTLEKVSARPRPRWDSGRPRLAMALSAGIHSLALMAFLVYHAFPPKKISAVPIFEMVSLEPPKLRPLKPKSPEPPPEKKVETRAPAPPKLTSKPKAAVPIAKPEPKVVKPVEDTAKPVKEAPEETAQPTTTLVANIPSDPRLSFWAGRVKKLVERGWNPPAGIETQGVVKIVVAFNVARDGTVSDIVSTQSSGNSMLDELALRVIQRLERTPPIPENFPNDVLQVSFEFLYGQ